MRATTCCSRRSSSTCSSSARSASTLDNESVFAMHSHRPILCASCIGVLALLTWATAPGVVRAPAQAWSRETFASRPAGRGLDWLSAPVGGYARIGERPLVEGYEAVVVDPEERVESARKGARPRRGEYTDLGR